MKIIDGNGLIDEIITNELNRSPFERGFLFAAEYSEKSDVINIKSYLSLDAFTEYNSVDRLVLSKKFIYASLKTCKENNQVYFLIHTHPFQVRNDLEFSPVDYNFFKNLRDLAEKRMYRSPLVFGVIGQESARFVGYILDTSKELLELQF